MFSKKLVAAALAVSGLVASSNALAISQFDLDLTAYGFDRTENIDFFDITGSSFITTSPIAVGNTFSLDALYKVAGAFNNSDLNTPINSGLDSGSYELYFKATGLTGYYTAVTGPGDFDFTYDAGVGSVELFLDSTFGGGLNVGTSTKIADLSVLAGGIGIANGPALKGTKGDIGLALAFTWAPAGVWFDSVSGSDASTKIATNQFLSVTNQNFEVIDVVGDLIRTRNNGTFAVDIPEPAPVALLGLGLLGFAFSRRRKA